MLTNYQFLSITQEKNTTTARVIFFEGDITTEDEYSSFTYKMESVTRYRRTAKLRELAFSVKQVLTLNEMEGLMKIELATDLTRTPHDAQKIT
jgi:hypothetical protein